MRILQVVSSRAVSYGGPVRTVAGITQVALDAGHEVDAFVVDELGAVTSFLGRPAYWPGLRGSRILHRQVRWADLVHVHGLWTPANTLACRLAYLRRRALVVSPHGTLEPWALARKRIKKIVYAGLVERRNLRRATALHCLTEREVKQVRRFGVETPAFVVSNGVPIESSGDGCLSSQRSHVAREEAPAWVPGRSFDTGRVVVLFLGRLVPQKGLEHLLPGFALAKREVPDLHLVLAGPDEDGYQHHLEALIRRYGVEDAVTFTGPVGDDVKSFLLHGSDIFALTSNSEGDSVALKEAFAAGLPAVVSPACIINDQVTCDSDNRSSEQAGSMSPSARERKDLPAIVVGWNPREVGTALIELARSPERRLQLGDRARAYARRHHSIERMGREMLRAYRTMLG